MSSPVSIHSARTISPSEYQLGCKLYPIVPQYEQPELPYGDMYNPETIARAKEYLEQAKANGDLDTFLDEERAHVGNWNRVGKDGEFHFERTRIWTPDCGPVPDFFDMKRIGRQLAEFEANRKVKELRESGVLEENTEAVAERLFRQLVLELEAGQEAKDALGIAAAQVVQDNDTNVTVCSVPPSPVDGYTTPGLTTVSSAESFPSPPTPEYVIKGPGEKVKEVEGDEEDDFNGNSEGGVWTCGDLIMFESTPSTKHQVIPYIEDQHVKVTFDEGTKETGSGDIEDKNVVNKAMGRSKSSYNIQEALADDDDSPTATTSNRFPRINNGYFNFTAGDPNGPLHNRDAVFIEFKKKEIEKKKAPRQRTRFHEAWIPLHIDEDMQPPSGEGPKRKLFANHFGDLDPHGSTAYTGLPTAGDRTTLEV